MSRRRSADANFGEGRSTAGANSSARRTRWASLARGILLRACRCRPSIIRRWMGMRSWRTLARRETVARDRRTAAGRDKKLRVSAGEAVRIFTGAPMPAGANAIVMQEDVTRDRRRDHRQRRCRTGEFVRQRGCDLAEGQIFSGRGSESVLRNSRCSRPGIRRCGNRRRRERCDSLHGRRTGEARRET